MKQKKELPSDPALLIKFTGYLNRYWQLLDLYPAINYKQAWKLLESEYYAAYGIHRYSSYDSFRVVRSRFIANLKRHKKR